MRWQKFFERRFNNWIEKRLPRTKKATLNSRSVFTYPSRAGFGFLSLLILLWLLATNYENNIIFALGALCGSIFVVTIFHSFANLSGLTIRVKSIGAGFPGDMLRVELEINQNQGRLRDDIKVRFSDSSPRQIAFQRGEKSVVATLYVPTKRRGKRILHRLTVESTYPLGLIRVWTHILLEGFGVVYPRPVEGDPRASGEQGETSEGKFLLEGREDFEGLKKYQPGENISRIAWKQLARGQGLYTKSFSDPVADPQWLDWEHYPGLDREARLSRLCYAVLENAKTGEPYGLRLPGAEYPLAFGERHRDKLLSVLALFEAPEV